MVGQAKVKPFQLDGNGQIVFNFWNGFPKVKVQTVSEDCVLFNRKYFMKSYAV